MTQEREAAGPSELKLRLEWATGMLRALLSEKVADLTFAKLIAQAGLDLATGDTDAIANADNAEALQSLKEACEADALRSGGEGWQDISTAPKDGGAVDLYADGRRWADFAWNVGLERWERKEGYPATTRVLLIEPTHFMVVLPPSPPTHGEG